MPVTSLCCRNKIYSRNNILFPFFAFDAVAISCIFYLVCASTDATAAVTVAVDARWIHRFKNEWLKDIDKRSIRSWTTMTTATLQQQEFLFYCSSFFFCPFYFVLPHTHSLIRDIKTLAKMHQAHIKKKKWECCLCLRLPKLVKRMNWAFAI